MNSVSKNIYQNIKGFKSCGGCGFFFLSKDEILACKSGGNRRLSTDLWGTHGNIRNKTLFPGVSERYLVKVFVAACKDSYVIYTCGVDRNGKWEWFCESKLCCKNVAAKMTLQNDIAALTTRWQAEQTALFLRINL